MRELYIRTYIHTHIYYDEHECRVCAYAATFERKFSLLNEQKLHSKSHTHTHLFARTDLSLMMAAMVVVYIAWACNVYMCIYIGSACMYK